MRLHVVLFLKIVDSASHTVANCGPVFFNTLFNGLREIYRISVVGGMRSEAKKRADTLQHVLVSRAGHVLFKVHDQSGLLSLYSCSRSSLSLVCQPGPVERKYSSTSRDSLNVTCSLVGAFCGPRPLRTSFSPSYKSAAWKKSSSISGASSGSTQVLPESFLFTFISFPHRDNTALVVAWSPNQNDKIGIKETSSYKTIFAVILPAVLNREVFTLEDQFSAGKVELSIFKSGQPFVFVIFDFHKTNRNYDIAKGQVNCSYALRLDQSINPTHTQQAPAKSGVGIATPQVKEGVNAPQSVERIFCVRLPRYGLPGRPRNGAVSFFAVVATCSADLHPIATGCWSQSHRLKKDHTMCESTPAPELRPPDIQRLKHLIAHSYALCALLATHPRPSALGDEILTSYLDISLNRISEAKTLIDWLGGEV